MNSAISLKGLTTCTPEFHRIAKAAELEAEANEIITKIGDDVDSLIDHGGYNVSNWHQRSDLTGIQEEIRELADLWEADE